MRWIKTLAIFSEDGSEFSKNSLTEVHIDLDQISNFNESNEGFTTVELNSGMRITIQVQFNDFKVYFYACADECVDTLVDAESEFKYGSKL